MKCKLFAVLLTAIFTLTGCATDDAGQDDSANGSISIELPEINTTANRIGVSDIDLFVLQITADSIEYSETIESETGGIINVGKLDEARYEITVEAFDADGDIILAGSNFAQVYVGEVTYAQIELDYTFGELDIAVILPGDDFIATLEINGIPLDNVDEITVIHGPGIYIERLGVPSAHQPGPSSSKVFSIETSGQNAVELISWFDNSPNLRDGSIIVTTIAGAESYRWNMNEMSPMFYQETSEGQTQFYLSVPTYLAEEFDSDLEQIYDENNDKGVEISGITSELIAGTVIDDIDNQTLTITIDFESGLSQLYEWTKSYEAGFLDRRVISVITFGAGGFGDEISRRNYYEVFVMSFEQINGFQNDIEGRFRVVLSYDQSEDG